MTVGNIHPTMAKRLRLSGILLIIAMAVEAFSFLWSNPTAFLVFTSVGGFFLVAGIGLFLFSLVTVPTEAPPE
jgi:hypothetical protein